MSGLSRAVEVAGSIDGQRQLHLEEPLPPVAPGPVRVIILFPNGGDIDEAEWMGFLAANPAFDFLARVSEDIYSPEDGRPLSVA